jgi:hypothetical protein
MSKKLARLFKPIFQKLAPYCHIYHYFKLPCDIISAYCYPSILLQSARKYSYRSPKGKFKPKELSERLYYSNEARVWTLPNAIATCRASHYDQHANLLWELSEQFRTGSPCKHPDFSLTLKRINEHMAITSRHVGSLIIDCPRNLYHWLYDGLPRLKWLLEAQIPIEALYVDLTAPFVKQSLEHLNCNLELIDASKVPSLQAKQMSLSSFPLYVGIQSKPVVDTSSLHWLKSKMALKNSKISRKLFISREDASYRFLIDEEKYYQQVKSKGFEKVVLSHYNLEDQIELFSSATAIIATHGAGLAHLCFCKPKTRVLEIFHPFFIQECYWQIAIAMDLNYYCLVGYHPANSVKSYPFSDIQIDEQEFVQAIKEFNL